MNITVKNCNSIVNGAISVEENKLNIKYAINGTGKTTISKAIEFYINDNKDSTKSLKLLKPFKFRDNDNTNNPEIEGIDSLNQVAIFNESYIDKFVFLPDELLKNSFEIFIFDEKYEQGINEINELIKDIGETFVGNQSIEELLSDLNELSTCFGKSKGLSKASSFVRGIGNGNKVANIPEGLTAYKDFIQHSENVSWLKWQMNGSDYIDISNVCPYCTSGVEDTKKKTILSVREEYDSNLIEHLNKVIGVVHRLKLYFTEDTYQKLLTISQSVDGLKREYESYLLEVRDQIQVLIEKINYVKYLNFQKLKNFDQVQEVINSYKIDLGFISHLASPATEEKIETINNSLDKILVQAGVLQGKVNIQKKHIEKTIKENNQDINTFLKYAGYNYQVNIEEAENQTYKIKLKHNDYIEANVDNVKTHLSFGEKNAFALVLFMFGTVKNNPDLVILDDPISSFDKNKKYAIIDMLFRGTKSLRGKTVLMLTHDFEPIVDMVYHHNNKFNAKASFLENIKGDLIEKVIERNDIKTFLEITKENIENLEEDLNKLIYLRRYMEINDDNSISYHLLSSLFKKRKEPIFKTYQENRPMTEEEIVISTNDIIKEVRGFDYNRIYGIVSNTEKLIEIYDSASNNYEKIQIYRILNIENSENDIIRKFVNETFHIENDYLYQLNPCKYQTIPEYIIDECNKDIEKLRSVVV